MIISRLRQGITSIPTLISDIVSDLVSGGMVLDGTYNVGDTTRYVLKASNTIDPLFESQSWRLVIHVIGNSYNVFACNAIQVTEEGDVVANGEHSKSGALVPNNNLEDEVFFSRDPESASWSIHSELPEGVGPEGVPLSSLVSCSDHGLVISTWAEGQDNRGDCFNWISVQRPVADDGTIIAEGKAPLFCVFSRDGGGSKDGLDTIREEGILKFVVSESDISAPTKPVSAVIPTPDSHPIINPLQQVAIAETFEYVMNFPKGLNTHRYYYEASLDMIAYTSADVISSSSTDDVKLFGEDSPRTYRAINANSLNNRGMRLLIQI